MTIAVTRKRPSTAVLRRRKRRRIRFLSEGLEGAAASGARVRSPSSGAGLDSDSRVQIGVDKVHQQIDRINPNCNNERNALNDGVVTLADGVKEEAAYSGPAEDNLD